MQIWIGVGMTQILKPIISLMMFLIVLFSVGTILSITTQYAMTILAIPSLASAMLAAWAAWKLVSGDHIHPVMAIASGALILGGLCFIIGFLGPMAIGKDTGQGPLVGIFIATPLGVIVGALAGYAYASRQKSVDSAME